MSEPIRSNRYFRALSDAALVTWRPDDARGWLGWSGNAGVNVSRCNREVRRRAAMTGCSGPCNWIGAVALREAL